MDQEITIDYRSRFIEFYFNELQAHPIFQYMNSLAEESPWHREDSIGIHTNMVVSEFISRSPDTWERVDMVGAMACAFHDFGKPKAMEVVYREDRGDYKRFPGHEKMSARIFEDWAVSNMDKMEYLGLELKHVHMIAWLCEYHLPWGIKKGYKREALARTALYIECECQDDPFCGEEVHDVNILERVLLSDTWGRISDDFETKRANALAWANEFTKLKIEMFYKHDADEQIRSDPDEEEAVLYMSIGAPASGKSTFGEGFGSDVLIHNWDNLREEFYVDEPTGDRDTDYDLAFDRSVEDKEFVSKCHQHFISLIKTGKSVYVDNTNASAKRRRFFVDQADRRGYRKVAVLFPTPLQTLLDRQKSRTDKTVPINAVKQIWESISMPQIGEFDEIWVIE